MNWPLIMTNISVLILGIQLMVLNYRVKKVAKLAAEQGQILAIAIWDLKKKVEENE